ncbi:hypothetical protein AB0758_30865 [Tolypothrix bouteillei VB521301_2]
MASGEFGAIANITDGCNNRDNFQSTIFGENWLVLTVGQRLCHYVKSILSPGWSDESDISDSKAEFSKFALAGTMKLQLQG